MGSDFRFTSFPLTKPPKPFATDIVNVFRKHEATISTVRLKKGLTSDAVLAVLRTDLESLGFAVERSKTAADRIERPVFFGENGKPTLNYQVDAYWEINKCGLEIEAGRAVMGNAIYRDLVQGMVMVGVEHLVIAVPNEYKYFAKKKPVSQDGYSTACEVARALYGHQRLNIPYDLLIIGY